MNKAESSIFRQLNPRAPVKCRISLLQDRLKARCNQKDGAWRFLTTGESGANKPSYGREWDRDYNPIPYPEARPEDFEAYMGTGVGLLYGIIECEEHAWQMAGWNLVRTGSETRKRKK